MIEQSKTSQPELINQTIATVKRPAAIFMVSFSLGGILLLSSYWIFRLTTDHSTGPAGSGALATGGLLVFALYRQALVFNPIALLFDPRLVWIEERILVARSYNGPIRIPLDQIRRVEIVTIKTSGHKGKLIEIEADEIHQINPFGASLSNTEIVSVIQSWINMNRPAFAAGSKARER
jgi:hypothetical protein